MSNDCDPQRFCARVVIDVPLPAPAGPIIWVPDEGSQRTFVPHVVPPEPPPLLVAA